MSIIKVKIFSLCLKTFHCATAKFPVFSLFGKSKNQIPCFLCAVATLNLHKKFRFCLRVRSHECCLCPKESSCWDKRK